MARKVIVILEQEALPIQELIDSLLYFFLHVGDNRNFFAKFASTTKVPHELRNQGIIELLYRFRNKRCEVPRDRVFSLLSLCEPSQAVEVDYAIPVGSLVYNILERVAAPLCMCSALLVAHALGLEEPHADGSSKFLNWDPYIKIELQNIYFGRPPAHKPPGIQLKLFSFERKWSRLHPGMMGSCPTLFRFLKELAEDLVRFDDTMARSERKDEAIRQETLPFLVRSMEPKHASALMHGYGDAFQVGVSSKDPIFVSTVRISLWLVVRILKHPVALCSKAYSTKSKHEYDTHLAENVTGWETIEEEKENGNQVNPHRRRSRRRRVDPTHTKRLTRRAQKDEESGENNLSPNSDTSDYNELWRKFQHLDRSFAESKWSSNLADNMSEWRLGPSSDERDFHY